jgi:hypothetical protein
LAWPSCRQVVKLKRKAVKVFGATAAFNPLRLFE